jgi:hypothetical protein
VKRPDKNYISIKDLMEIKNKIVNPKDKIRFNSRKKEKSKNPKIRKTKSFYVLTKLKTFILANLFYVQTTSIFCPLYHFGYSVIKSRELYFHHFPTRYIYRSGRKKATVHQY